MNSELFRVFPEDSGGFGAHSVVCCLEPMATLFGGVQKIS